MSEYDVNWPLLGGVAVAGAYLLSIAGLILVTFSGTAAIAAACLIGVTGFFPVSLVVSIVVFEWWLSDLITDRRDRVSDEPLEVWSDG